MTWYRVCLACAVSVALMACTEAEQGVLQPQGPLAGLRYVNLVNDTGAVDFRIVNFIGDAPSAAAAAFRTGGMPYGQPTNYLPPHWPVQADREVNIKVFMNGLDPAVSSLVVFDTTCTFAVGVNYTFFLYGNARTPGGVHSLVTVDDLTAAPAGVAFRVINLGGTAVGAVDVDVVPRDTVAPLPGAVASFPAVAAGIPTAYTNFAVSGTLKATITAPATRTPFLFSFVVPAGVVGTTTVNPIAGTAVAGTAISAVIVPASVTGSRAPQTGNPSSKTTVTVTRSTNTVLVEVGSTTTIKNRVWRVGIDTGRTLDTAYALRLDTVSVPRRWVTDTTIRFRRRADSSLTAVGNTHGFAAGDIAVVSGATETEYNGWHNVTQVADTTTCLPADPVADVRTSCALLAADTLRVLVGDTTPPLARFYTSTVRSRFRYRIGSTTAATPATGTVTFRVYAAANQANPSLSNYTIPWVLFLIDRKPTLTAP
jgi:hypothetical protein